MLGKIKNVLMGAKPFADNAENDQDKEQLALASLLVEMARADFDESADDHSFITDLLADHYELSATEARQLLNKAREANDKAVCLFDFTRSLHDCLDANQKQAVIVMLWRVALADARLDKYEEFLVRKVADLLYIPHSDVMRLKHEVLGDG